MKFRFIWVGKTKDKNYRALQEDYLQRLSHFARFEIDEIRDSNAGKDHEGKRILEKLNQNSLVCVLDVLGKPISSTELAKELEGWQMSGWKEVAMVVGGADGLSRDVAEKADIRLSLSFLTFTHEMARVVMLEQLYRAFTIIKGYPYQR